MNDAKLRTTANDNKSYKFIEECVDKKMRKQSISQVNSEMIECKYTSASISEYESELPLVSIVKNNSMEIVQHEKYTDNKTMPRMDEKVQKNLKEEDMDVPSEKVQEIIKNQVYNTKDTLPGKARRSKREKYALSLTDSLISVGVIGPSVIGFWRGVWVWMDLHAEWFPSWFCFTFGAILHITFTFFKSRFYDSYVNKRTKSSPLMRLSYYILRTFYIYAFGVACNAQWRGGWIIIDDYLFMHIWITVCLMCLLLACLMILRCVRNLIAPPLIIFIDTPSCIFQFPTRYNVKYYGSYYSFTCMLF